MKNKKISERMKLNNPMKNIEVREKMRKSKIDYYENLRKNGIKDKRKKYDCKGYRIDLKDKKSFIIEKYNSGLTLRQVGNLLGVSANTIKRRMIKWGCPRRIECKYSSFHTSEDGHIVKSSMELLCDNWLFNNGIIHVYEKRLGETRFSCDFYIPKKNLYIEIFGLTDDIYKERFKRKMEVYKRLGLGENIFIIFPKDKINEKLNFLLEISETQRSVINYEKD